MGIFGTRPSVPMPQLGPDPYEGQRPETAPGLFGKGRGLRDGIGYALGIAAQRMGGTNPYDTYMAREQKQQDEEAALQHQMALLRLKSEMEASTPQYMNTANGGVGMVQGGNFSWLNPPTPDDRRTNLERNFEWFSQLPPEQQRTARLMLPGAGLTDEAIAGKIRLKQAVPGKAPGAGGGRGGGGGGVPGATRAKLISEAEAAIAAGAPREAVYARLAKMGVR